MAMLLLSSSLLSSIDQISLWAHFTSVRPQFEFRPRRTIRSDFRLHHHLTPPFSVAAKHSNSGKTSRRRGNLYLARRRRRSVSSIHPYLPATALLHNLYINRSHRAQSKKQMIHDSDYKTFPLHFPNGPLPDFDVFAGGSNTHNKRPHCHLGEWVNKGKGNGGGKDHDRSTSCLVLLCLK